MKGESFPQIGIVDDLICDRSKQNQPLPGANHPGTYVRQERPHPSLPTSPGCLRRAEVGVELVGELSRVGKLVHHTVRRLSPGIEFAHPVVELTL